MIRCSSLLKFIRINWVTTSGHHQTTVKVANTLKNETNDQLKQRPYSGKYRFNLVSEAANSRLLEKHLSRKF